MPDVPADSMDRLLAGELSRDEERRLARAALDDPDLFEALTAAAVARSVLATEGAERSAAQPAALSSSTRKWGVRNSAALLAGLAAAAVLVLAVAFGWRTERTTSPSTATSAETTALAPLAAPVLLLAHAGVATTPVFRSDAAPVSRPPRSSGTLVRSTGSIAEINLGSLDGLTQGMSLPVVRGAHTIGTLTLAAVFRDRAKGRIEPAPTVLTGARIEIDPATYVRAVVAHVSSRVESGDLPGAHELVSVAAAASRNPAVPVDLRRRSLATLGAVEYHDGHRDNALHLLEEAAGSFDALPPATSEERSNVLNQLGVIQIDTHDFAAAERTLTQAQSLASGAAAVYVANNRGALAALRGDRASAERQYRAASSLAAGVPDLEADRRVIDRNLASLPAPR